MSNNVSIRPLGRPTVTAAEIVAGLGGGNGMARCPAHDDKKPSLSVSDGKNGITLLHCHAGCEQQEVIAALKARGLWHAPGRNGNSSGQIVYPYTNEKGKVVHQTVRAPGKKFWQRQPDGKGGYINNLKGLKLVIYNLPEVLKADYVFVVEGEKDANTIAKLGLKNAAATTNAGGAGKWRDEYSEMLQGKYVVILPDADDPGRKHALQVARSVLPMAKSVRIVELEGAKDITEWVEAGRTREEFLASVKAAPKVASQDAVDEIERGWFPNDNHVDGVNRVGNTPQEHGDSDKRVKRVRRPESQPDRRTPAPVGCR